MTETTSEGFPGSASGAPKWMSTTLWAAAIYNLAWGGWVVARPGDLFRLSGIEPPLYPGIWQCVGMIVGVYGVGYAIAATAPLRHWPIVLVGLLGKLFGPIGFLLNRWAAGPGDAGVLPWNWAWTLVTNDLIWWVPFSMILYAAFRQAAGPASTEAMTAEEANLRVRTQGGQTLAELSRDQTLMVVFLRHQGCTFCREAVADLVAAEGRLRQLGVSPVLVHMGTDAEGADFFRRYGAGDWPRVSDPDGRLYRSYRLPRGKFWELFGPAVWGRGFRAAVLRGHAVGRMVGDGFQLGGVFLVRDGRVVAEYRQATSADRPDYCELAGRPIAAVDHPAPEAANFRSPSPVSMDYTAD